MIISIREPFSLKFCLLDMEERFPSLYFDVEVFSSLSSVELSFRRKLWVDQQKWKTFIERLSSPSSFCDIQAESNIRLQDMSAFFCFEIYRENDQVFAAASYARVEGFRQNKFSIGDRIDEDMLARIQRAFNDSPLLSD